MGIERFKRWQWVLIGALVGIALAYMWTNLATSIEGLKSSDPVAFERDVTLKDESSGLPFITGIVIHPQEDSFEGPVNVVTYKRLARDRSGRIGWLSKRMVAKIPYTPVIPGRVEASGDLTIQGYLEGLARSDNTVRFHYGWWLEPKKALIIGSLLGMLIIGGVWPSLLNVMVGAGLGRKADPEEDARRKSGFDWGSLVRMSKKPAAGGAGRPQVSAADQRHVQDVADAYERGLAGSAVATASAGASVAQAEGTVRKLEGGPLEAAKPMAKPEDEDDIEVKGEYYPVLIHHKKQQASDQKGDAQKQVQPQPPQSKPSKPAEN
ncbi:MAG TPA: hypothetical protein VH518_00880 [Tepidisphaeraceae bacterium]|jgi:hypothetical protein